MITLGQQIASFRKSKGMTQETLAEQCSVSPQAVSKWENDITAPDISLLPKLASIFGVTVDELIGVKRSEVVAVDKTCVDISKMFLRIRVLSGDGDKVNLNIPLVIAEALLKNGKLSVGSDDKLSALKDIDFAEIITLIKEGAVGKILEVESGDGDKVEIFVE